MGLKENSRRLLFMGTGSLLLALLMETPSDAQTSTQSVIAATSVATAVESERSCVPLFSNGVQSLQGKRIPVLVVTVGLDAKLHSPALSRSTGDAALDKAFLRCADGYPFKPVTVEGKPAAVQWVMAYFIVPEGHVDGFVPATSNGKNHICQNWPGSAVSRKLNGDAVVAYRIGVDGSTKDIKLTQSTGDADLDKATINCVAAWKFFPALQNGHPVEIERIVGQHWRSHP